MPKGHAVLRFLRKVHLYVGIFTTPALLFFAITGAFQTFSLHETTQGSSYKPPAWIATLAQLHKKQTTVVPVRKARPAGPDGAPHDGQGGDRGSKEARRKTDLPVGATGSKDASKAAGLPRLESTPPPAPQKSHLPMKIFFLLVAVSLLLSTLTGIYMAYKYSRGWLVMTGLLAAGVIIPLLLLPF